MNNQQWSEWMSVTCQDDMPKDESIIGVWRGDDGFISKETELYNVSVNGGRNVIAYRYKIGQPEVNEEEERCWKEKEALAAKATMSGKDQYSTYFKDVRHLDYIDVYRTVDLFDCETHGHAISHAAKKLLLTGSRTGGKDVETDVREAIDSLRRWLEMRKEDKGREV